MILGLSTLSSPMDFQVGIMCFGFSFIIFLCIVYCSGPPWMPQLAFALHDSWVTNASVIVVYVMNDACLALGLTGDYSPSGYTRIFLTWPP